MGAARGTGQSESLLGVGQTRRALGSTPEAPGSRTTGFRSQGMGRGPNRPETLLRRHLLPRVKSSYVGLLLRGLFVVCSFLQLVVPGGRLGSDCFSPKRAALLVVPRRPGAALPCQQVPAVPLKASSLANIPELRLFCGCFSADCRYLCFADILFWFWFLHLTCFFFITETVR